MVHISPVKLRLYHQITDLKRAETHVLLYMNYNSQPDFVGNYILRNRLEFLHQARRFRCDEYLLK